MATYGVRFVNSKTGKKVVTMSGETKEKAMKFRDDMNAMYVAAGWDNIQAVVFIEMNAHEKVVSNLIQQGVSEFIGGRECTMLDYAEDSEEYQIAKAGLNHDGLFSEIYNYVMAESKENYASHIRFAGKQFIEERIEARLKKEGYGKEVQ